MNQSQITLEDFLPALEALLETETEYCLVGGLAVGVWAEVFLTPIEKTRFELPIRSKDIDIRAAKADAMMFLRNLQERGYGIGTICKLNAIQTRPPGESENDLKHSTLLSLVIPRFIQRTLERNQKNQDRYHPRIDAQRLTGFLSTEPWMSLIPKFEREAIITACRQARGDEGTDER